MTAFVFFGLVIVAIVIVAAAVMLTIYSLPEDEDTPRSCPPCDHQCNQGRNCPARENV